jgi:hypothetical protein
MVSHRVEGRPSCAAELSRPLPWVKQDAGRKCTGSEGQLPGTPVNWKSRPQPVLPGALENLASAYMRVAGFRRRVWASLWLGPAISGCSPPAGLGPWNGENLECGCALLPCSAGVELWTKPPKQEGVRPVNEGLNPCGALAEGAQRSACCHKDSLTDAQLGPPWRRRPSFVNWRVSKRSANHGRERNRTAAFLAHAPRSQTAAFCGWQWPARSRR